MIELFITLILICFFGLFAVMAFPMKEEVEKLNQQSSANQHGTQAPD